MEKYTFREHFRELKKRFFKLFGMFIIAFGLCYWFSDNIYRIILSPLVEITGDNSRKIIYTGLTEAFFSYIKISAFAAVILIFPFCCYQLYAFISPGLHREERKIIAGVLSLSPILFYSGCFFMFYLVMPNAWLFFISYEKVDVGVPLVLEARISEYLSLVIQLMLAFGLSFQLPIVMIVLSSIGLISTEALKRKRRIAIVVIFVVAAILTPPDVFSQIALAIPLLLLYEFSILLCKLLEKKSLKNVRYKMD